MGWDFSQPCLQALIAATSPANSGGGVDVYVERRLCDSNDRFKMGVNKCPLRSKQGAAPKLHSKDISSTRSVRSGLAAIYNYFLFAREVILLHSTSGERSQPQVLCKSITSQAKRK